MQLLEDLFTAYYDARKHKRKTVNQLKFEFNFEHELISLCDEILNRTYRMQPSICFVVEEPVKREVFAADFRDRVIHHLIYNYINPVLELSFIHDSYSCRKNRGTLYGIKQAEEFIRDCSENYTCDCYILKLDIRGYFMNIDKHILLSQIKGMLDPEKKAEAYQGLIQPDWEMVDYLIEKVVFHDPKNQCIIKGNYSDWNGLPPSKSLFHSPDNCGLPIGNLTSQLFSNVYLHPFDLYMKNDLGLKYYGRYVDDFVIIDRDKARLKQIVGLSDQFLKNELKLELHPNKVYLQHHAKGVKFLGAIIKPGRRLVAERTKKNLVRSLRRWDSFLSQQEPTKEDLFLMRASINSYLGIFQHFKSFGMLRKIVWKTPHRFLQYGWLSEDFSKFNLYPFVASSLRV
jgi:retron-type reverse transcriptase